MSKRKEYYKQWYQENKEKQKKSYKEYYQKNKEREKKNDKEYRQKNKERIEKYQKEYRQKNKERILIQNRKSCRKFYQKNLISWEGYIPKETNCQICDRKIYFNQNNKKDAICFDHKKENILIKGSPTGWLGFHLRTSENQKIWEGCDFGMLCNQCNQALPTKNREQFMKNVMKYIFKNKFNE